MIVDLPELKLQGEDLLDVYTFRGTTQPGSDWEKQAFFGGKLLDLAITHHWLAQSLSVQEIVDNLDNFLDENGLSGQCIAKYELEKNLIRPESTPVGVQECRDFLCINVAKLWNYGGMSAVQGWVSALIQPGSVPPHVPQAAGPGARIEPPSMNGLRLSSPEPSASSSAAANGSEPLSFITLQIFNEHAVQKKKHIVTWQDTASGDAHCLLWTSRCSLDGQVRGVGQGPSKKNAQEKAAREVWRAMGWSSASSNPSSAPQSPVLPTTFAQSLDSESSLPPAYSPPPGDTGLEWLTSSHFHQVVTQQRRLSVEWRQERSGEPHTPTWRVTCILDGQEKGTGVASNTKEAKHLAARDAWRNMGWSTTPT
ncbi:hypothetical protein JOM56_006705 [Amanita muscaria]